MRNRLQNRGAWRLLVALLFGCLGGAAFGQADNYPSRPITFIVPYGPAGSTDPVARQFVSQLEKVLGTDIDIENKPGGSGTLGFGIVMRAKPDGYTLGLGTNSMLAYQPLVNPALTFKTPDDYQPIVKLGETPIVLVVRADSPWKTFDEFMAHVRANPGKVRAAVSGKRTVPDLLAQEFNLNAKVNLRTVPFTGGSGEALVALLGNRVEATLFTGAFGIPGHVQAGKLRVLAVFKKGPYGPLPEAFTTIDAGYKTTITASFYVLAPKGLPKPVLDKLTAASMQVVKSPEFAEFAKVGYALDPLGPEGIREEIIHDTATFKELIKLLDASK